MPILKKQVQDKASRPEFLRDEEEVFHCQMTNEIFRDYEDFAERTILCNSMVWTCSMTGKSNLTYTEALQSEENARRMLQDFPYELRIPLLFLASKTKRNSFKDMAEDVWSYMKDRYFVGENIEACFSDNKWRDYHVLQVMAPGDDDKKKSPIKINGQTTDRNFQPHPSLYKYDLEQLDAEDEDISEKIMVDMTQMRRKKGIYSKDKNKLFLKQYVEQGSSGYLAVKESALESFGIHKIKFDQIFDGPQPQFGESSRKGGGVVNGKKVKQETLAKFLTKEGKQGTSKKNGELLEKMKQRELEFKRKKEELKQKATDDKEKRKLEESKIQGLIKDWFKPKDDLEVEDQRILPVPTSVQCRIPEKYLGDAFCLLEFINAFKKALKTKDIFSSGLTLELLERALMDKEVAGPLPDIVQLLLGSIFRTREEEAVQYKSYCSASGMRVIREEEIPDEMSMAFASRAATSAWYWSKRQHGFPLSQLSLYSVTVTEILRIHLLSSGATESEDCTRWRFQMRGGYTAEDDPGLYLRLQCPQLLRSLAVQNIIELSCGDKLTLLLCLMNQLLTYTVFRDQAEDARESMRANKLKIRSLASKKKPAPQKEGSEKKTTKPIDPVEIEKQLDALQKDNLNNLITLGTDRSYRRYIKLESIPGFFVENEEDNAGICLASPTKQYPQLNGCKKAILSKHLLTMSEEMNTSDKENEPKSPSKKMVNGFSSKMDITDNARLLNMCTANPSNCFVHCSKQSNTKTTILSRWTFYHNDTQVDDLIAGLNVRGLRESELKQILQSNESRIRNLVSKTPINQLSAPLAAILEKEALEAAVTENTDTNGIDEEQQQQQQVSSSRPVRSSRGRRSGASNTSSTHIQNIKKQRYDDVTLGYPEGASPNEVMHLAITDNLLEMEEKICGGNLGHLKLSKGFSREKWRELLTARDWDRMDGTIVHAKDLYKVVKESGSRPATPTHPDNQPQVARKEDRYREYMDPGTFIGHNEEDLNASSNVGAIEQLIEVNSEHSRAIKGLALALAQLGQSVGNKYLKKPLGHGDVGSSKSLVTKDILPRWQQSLLASTGYSQLFLHYNTLDSCIMWSRSALLAWCRICKRKRDSENMLLCDSCNNGHHLYCLRPKLTSVPKGDWFCDKCKREREPEEDLLPLEVIPRKKRRIFRDEDVSEEEETEDEEEWVEDQTDEDEKEPQEDADEDQVDVEDEEEEEQEEVIVDNQEDDDDVDDDDDVEEEEEEVEDEIEEEFVDEGADQVEEMQEVDVDQLGDDEDGGEEESEDILMDECNHCKSGGELLSCEDCKLSYHLECVNPPLRRAPRGTWTCIECKERKECEDSDELTSSTRRSNRRDIDQRDDLPLHNAALQELLKDVMKHKDAWPFIRPVQKNEVPDYYKVIERPMDFGTIKYKLNMGEYNFDAEFMADSVLVFENCNTYNNSDADVYKCGVRLLKHFSKKCNELGLKTPEEMQFDEEDNQPIAPKAKKRRNK